MYSARRRPQAATLAFRRGVGRSAVRAGIVQFNADVMAVKAFCRKPRRAAAEKRVKHNAALGTARQNAGFRQLRRERGEMPALVGYGVDMPYDAFWDTLKTSKESTYSLIKNHHISSSTIDKLRKNKPLNTTTINDLCRILNCQVQDIMTYIPSSDDQIL